MTISHPCKPGAGFDNCSSFKGQGYHSPDGPGIYKPVPPGACPVDDTLEEYDPNHLRMIEKVTYGYKFGLSPDRDSPGLEVVCCSVM